MSSEAPHISLNLSTDGDQIDRSALDPANLKRLAEEAMPLILRDPGPHENSLSELEAVDVILVSDETIARVHGDFLDDPTPTDVITFHHGEILVSTDTAAAAAAEYGHSPARETLLYMIHGLLHLNGHHDAEPTEHAEMHRIQDDILDSIWPLNS